MDAVSFFNTYYVQPLCSPVGGYNIYNTLTYGLLTAFVAFLLYRLFMSLKVNIDLHFFFGASMYVLLGSFWHVFEDTAPKCMPYLEAPIIYLLFASIGIAVMLVGLLIERKTKTNFAYWKTMIIVASVAIIASAISFYKIVQPIAALKILGVTLIFGLFFFAFSKKWKTFFTPINMFVLTSAMFDAASTAIGVSQYDYSEKHILPTFLINLTGTAWIMIPLKFIVIMGALYAIDKMEKDTQFNNIVKFAILCVTLGPGTRNTLRILMGV